MINIVLGILEGAVIMWCLVVLFDYVVYVVKPAPKRSNYPSRTWLAATLILGGIIGWHFLV